MAMTSKERVMAALQLKEPDRVPFMDWINSGIRAECEKAFGKGPLDEAQFAREIGFDAIGYNDFHALNPIFDETLQDAVMGDLKLSLSRRFEYAPLISSIFFPISSF